MGKREEGGWEDWQSCSLACPPPPSGRKCYETWSDKMLPFPRGFASSDCSPRPGMLRGEQVASSQGEQGTPGTSAVGSAAFSREERGRRASPEHDPSLRMLRGVQDLPGPASLFGLCIAGSGSRLINRFQALPSAEASVSVFPLPTPPPSCNPSLTTWAWHRAGQELAGGKTREILRACLSPLVFYLPVQP